MTRLNKDNTTTAAAAITTIAAAVVLCASGIAHAAGSPASVHDTTPPVGAVGGVQTPIAPGGTLGLVLEATDTGVGLANAEASLDEQSSVFVRLGSGACPEHPSFSGGTVTLPAGADCPESVYGVSLPLNVGTALGPHQLRVRVTDAAGNVATLVDQTIVVQSPSATGTNKVTLGIGGPGNSSSGGSSGSGGVAGFTASGGGSSSGTTGGGGGCPSPLLTMRFASRAVRYTRRGRVPVLLYDRRYRYRGTLTCLPTGSHKRVSAPDGTLVQALTVIGHRVLKTGRGTMTIHHGQFSAYLKYTRPVTVLFRFQEPDGELLQVKIPIQIIHPRAKTKGQGGR